LDYYNHNLDTSREHYGEVITTRTYDERLDTLQAVRDAGINVCSGGILGLGEARKDRVGLLWQLANMNPPPESVPINQLVSIEGTPLHEKGVERVDPIEFIRTIAVARILMPKSYIRLSAGRETQDEAHQTLCFFAGANSIFAGAKLLTTTNPQVDADKALFAKLGLSIAAATQIEEPQKCRPPIAASSTQARV
jgi:biotin synthase